MSAPAILIRLELEAAPRLFIDAVSDREHDRILDWIASHPDYVRLIHAALELERREKAA